jgi:hypothetical protein
MTTLALNTSLENLLKSLSKLSFFESELSKDEVNEPSETYRLSEKTLSKDWMTKEEEEAWKDF